jgi:hypothetical protein
VRRAAFTLVCGAALLCAGAASAQITLGLHAATAHVSKDAKDDNPGLYAVAPFGIAGGRVMLGGYRNSLNTTPRRTSLYFGQTWQFDNWSLAAIVVSGYDKRRYLDREEGFWHQKWMPVVVPSYALPPVFGVTPRLSLVGVKKPAIHLSLETTL